MDHHLIDSQLNWLLEKDMPGVCYLAMRDLLHLPMDDPAMVSARVSAYQQGPVADILVAMNDEGYWVKPGPGYGPKYKSTVWSIILLAQLGASVEFDSRVEKGCKYLLDHALAAEGQFSYNGAPSGTFDCLQGNLCWALLELGCTDPRIDKAVEWMARSVTGEGISPASDRQAAVRYYVYQCGPNFACGANGKLPCAWGAIKVMLALGRYPEDRRTPLIRRAIQQGVDFLLKTDPVLAEYPTVDQIQSSRNWWKFGFPVFYVADILQIAEVILQLGLQDDPRMAGTYTLIREKQDEDGRWKLEYDYTSKTWCYFGTKMKPNKWVTLRALKVLQAVEKGLHPASQF